MTRQEASPRRRAPALVAALCVFVLSLLAASPEWHAKFHGDQSAHSAQSAPVGTADHECAVTFFAGGVEALLIFCLLMLVRPLTALLLTRAVDDFVVTRPRYLLVPSQGPPVV